MITAGVIALAIGLFQFWLQVLLSKAVMKPDKRRLIAIIPLKLAVYIAAVTVLVMYFRSYVAGAAVGFGIGFFVSLIIYYIRTFTTDRKNSNENGGELNGDKNDN